MLNIPTQIQTGHPQNIPTYIQKGHLPNTIKKIYFLTQMF
jgi:hypothetical protein